MQHLRPRGCGKRCVNVVERSQRIRERRGGSRMQLSDYRFVRGNARKAQSCRVNPSAGRGSGPRSVMSVATYVVMPTSCGARGWLTAFAAELQVEQAVWRRSLRSADGRWH
ncbi:hypothetical protein MRX96_021934 [Rhipicephalus microplus]